MGEKFIDPEVVRWEKHRVWIIEGDAERGQSPPVQQASFYIDEDSWAGLAAENYDGGQPVAGTVSRTARTCMTSSRNFHLPMAPMTWFRDIQPQHQAIPGQFKNGVDQKIAGSAQRHGPRRRALELIQWGVASSALFCFSVLIKWDSIME